MFTPFVDRQDKTDVFLNKEEKSKINYIIVNQFDNIMKIKTHININDKKIINNYKIVSINNKIYSLIYQLGKGSYGKVYKAYDIFNDKYVAIKAQFVVNDMDKFKVDNQYQLTSKNGIANICKDCMNGPPELLKDKHSYFVLPLAETCYDKWLIKNKTDNSKILKSLMSIINDLEKLHSNDKYCHMDIKANNILINNDIAYLADFGNSKKLKEVCKTLNYPRHKLFWYPPEMFNGKEFVIEKSFDIFSLGILFSKVADIIRDPVLKKELNNISKYMTRTNPKERYSLIIIKSYIYSLISKL